MQGEVEDLRAEVAELREDLDNQAIELARLRRVVSRLEKKLGLDSRDSRSAASDSRTPPRTPPRTVSDGYQSEDSYSVVTEVGRPRAEPSTSLPRSTASGAGTTATSTKTCSLTWKQREDIADQVGRWLGRAVAGQARGLSGREKNPLGSRIWIVVRDYAGQIYDPVRAFKTWTPCKDLVRPGGVDPADSIFCGFPSEREAKRAVEIGGFIWPSVIEG